MIDVLASRSRNAWTMLAGHIDLNLYFSPLSRISPRDVLAEVSRIDEDRASSRKQLIQQ
jgi:hypothetical protein